MKQLRRWFKAHLAEVKVATLALLLATLFALLVRAKDDGLSFEVGMFMFGICSWLAGSLSQSVMNAEEVKKLIERMNKNRLPAEWVAMYLHQLSASALDRSQWDEYPYGVYRQDAQEIGDPRERYNNLTIFRADWQETEDDFDAIPLNEGDFPNHDDDVNGGLTDLKV